MPVPMIDLTLQHRRLMAQFAREFERVAGTAGFVLGRDVEAFEHSIAGLCQTRHAIGISSGTDALLVALMAMDIGQGDEVITSPFTFFATAGCISRVGATPAFVDIDPRTYNIDTSLIERAITPRTRAIMPVHLFGHAADMTAIMTIARRHKLRVIEDAAQAIGAKDHGRVVGSIGDVGCLSFYPTKNLSAMGDGGACVTSDDTLNERMLSLRVHGIDGEPYKHRYIGGNFRIDALQAAMLNVKLPLLEEWTANRRSLAQRYDGLLSGLPLVLSVQAEGYEHVYNQYTLRVPEGQRAALMEHLTQRGIGNRIYYPIALHMQPCFASLGYERGALPLAEAAAEQVLSLPMFPEMTHEQQDEVVLAVRDFFA